MIGTGKNKLFFVMAMFLCLPIFVLAETSEYDFESAAWTCTCAPYPNHIADGKWQWNNLDAHCAIGATACVEGDIVYQGTKAAVFKQPAGTTGSGYTAYDDGGVYQKFWFRTYFYIKDDPNITGESLAYQKFNFVNTKDGTDIDGNSYNYQIGTSLIPYSSSDESKYAIQVGTNHDGTRGSSFYATPGTQQATNVRMHRDANGSNPYLDFTNTPGGVPDWIKPGNLINITGATTNPYDDDRGDTITSVSGNLIKTKGFWAWTNGIDEPVTVVCVPPIEANKWHYYEFYEGQYYDDTQARYVRDTKMWLDNDQYYTEKIFKMGKSASGVTNIKLLLNSSQNTAQQDRYIYGDAFRFSTDSLGGKMLGNETPACADSDWSFSDGACQIGGTLIRTWTKSGNCAGGVIHSDTEAISCNYKYTLSDFANFYNKWGKNDSTYDLNKDGIVNSKDLGMMMRNFL